MQHGVTRRIWAFIVAAALIVASTAQTAVLWQCRHASVIVASTARLALGHSDEMPMPCRMAGVDMASMPCCRHMGMAPHTAGRGPQLSDPGCAPKLVVVATISAARLVEKPAPHAPRATLSWLPAGATIARVDVVSRRVCPRPPPSPTPISRCRMFSGPRSPPA